MTDPHPPPEPPEKPSRSGKGRSNPGAQEIAAAALAAGATAKDAAASAGVHERTVRKWQATPEFRERVQALRDEVVGQALNRLGSGMSAAADALRNLVDHSDPHVKYKAARAVIELAVKLKEQLELEQRVEELERQAQIGERLRAGGRR
jgi:hypothetical protein